MGFIIGLLIGLVIGWAVGDKTVWAKIKAYVAEKKAKIAEKHN